MNFLSSIEVHNAKLQCTWHDYYSTLSAAHRCAFNHQLTCLAIRLILHERAFVNFAHALACASARVRLAFRHTQILDIEFLELSMEQLYII